MDNEIWLTWCGQAANYVTMWLNVLWQGQAAIYYILVRRWFYHGMAKRPLMAFLFTGILSLCHYFSGNNEAMAPQCYLPSIPHICEEAWYIIYSYYTSMHLLTLCRHKL